jgi:hypothetical protein
MDALRRVWLPPLLLVLSATAVFAHHSFAVFFDDTRTLEITGTVSEFRFTNPHGLITLSVKSPQGVDVWRVETNAPTLLRRRGWTADSLKPGDVVTVDGWRARDGARFLRMRRVTKADGTVLGTAAGAGTAPPSGTPR